MSFYNSRAQNHGNHQAAWAKDQALEGALDRLARQCQWPWAAGVFPGAVPRPPAAAQGQAPPAALVVPVPAAPVPVPACLLINAK